MQVLSLTRILQSRPGLMEWADGTDIPTKSHQFFSGVPYHHLVGKMHDGARLGEEFVEDLPESKVV